MKSVRLSQQGALKVFQRRVEESGETPESIFSNAISIGKHGIYSIPEFPRLIFKSGKQRLTNNFFVSKIIKENCLAHLSTPSGFVFGKYTVEEKKEIVPQDVAVNVNNVTLMQKHLSEFLLKKAESDLEIKEWFIQIYREAAIFVIEGKFWDVSFSNLPIDNSGSGFIVIDTDSVEESGNDEEFQPVKVGLERL